MADIADLRKEYTLANLDVESIDKNPFEQFTNWFNEAKSAELIEPNAMVISTVDEQNQPFQRTVLMKGLDTEGIIFFTNFTSRKGQQIAKNKQVSLLFPWYLLERQVAIIGHAERISEEETEKYFKSRPHGSQLGAWVSYQSTEIASRQVLENRLKEMELRFEEGKVPVPEFWGGFRVYPSSFEFWQGRPSRLHDRILYEKSDTDWNIKRLSP